VKSTIEDALARRTKLEIVEKVESSSSQGDQRKLAGSVLDGLRKALLGGETHYTDRPGIGELREAIGRRIGRSADDVVVTSGLREALFVSLLALERRDVPVFLSPGALVHKGLCQILGIAVRETEPTETPVISVREIREPSTPVEKLFDLVLTDDAVFERGWVGSLAPRLDPASSIVLGTLDSLPGLSSFRVGFTSAPSTSRISPRLKRWKQALSICTSAPSQRAALLTLSDIDSDSEAP
jgi:aspartate/methionine/tyrosine aminotransferase